MVNYLKWLNTFTKSQTLQIKQTIFKHDDNKLPNTAGYLYSAEVCKNNNDDNEYPNGTGWWPDSVDFDTQVETNSLQNVCLHEWKKYVGFTEIYFFCEKCDLKSEKDPIWWKK